MTRLSDAQRRRQWRTDSSTTCRRQGVCHGRWPRRCQLELARVPALIGQVVRVPVQVLAHPQRRASLLAQQLGALRSTMGTTWRCSSASGVYSTLVIVHATCVLWHWQPPECITGTR